MSPTAQASARLASAEPESDERHAGGHGLLPLVVTRAMTALGVGDLAGALALIRPHRGLARASLPGCYAFALVSMNAGDFEAALHWFGGALDHDPGARAFASRSRGAAPSRRRPRGRARRPDGPARRCARQRRGVDDVRRRALRAAPVGRCPARLRRSAAPPAAARPRAGRTRPSSRRAGRDGGRARRLRGGPASDAGQRRAARLQRPPPAAARPPAGRARRLRGGDPQRRRLARPVLRPGTPAAKARARRRGFGHLRGGARPEPRMRGAPLQPRQRPACRR